MKLQFNTQAPFLGLEHPMDLPVFAGPFHGPVELLAIDPELKGDPVVGILTSTSGRSMATWPLTGGEINTWNWLHYADIEPSINWDHVHEAYNVLSVNAEHTCLAQGLNEYTEYHDKTKPFKVFRIETFSSFYGGQPEHPDFVAPMVVARPGYKQPVPEETAEPAEPVTKV
jgi:hypothetical protein